MMRYFWIIISIISLLYTTSSGAATVIKRQGAQSSKIETVVLADHQARIEGSEPDYYKLFNLKEKMVYDVDQQEKMVVKIPFVAPELPNMAPRFPARPLKPIKAQLVKKGAGPDIAGYPTVHYQIIVDDKVCSEEYLSEKAIQVDYIKTFLRAMHEMSDARSQAMKNLPKHPCQRAHEQLETEALAIGLPMKSVTTKGKVRHEIMSIKADVKVDADLFALPKGYQVKTEREIMEEIRRQMMQDSRRRYPPEEELTDDDREQYERRGYPGDRRWEERPADEDR
jgi:hypothetical protein